MERRRRYVHHVRILAIKRSPVKCWSRIAPPSRVQYEKKINKKKSIEEQEKRRVRKNLSNTSHSRNSVLNIFSSWYLVYFTVGTPRCRFNTLMRERRSLRPDKRLNFTVNERYRWESRPDETIRAKRVKTTDADRRSIDLARQCKYRCWRSRKTLKNENIQAPVSGHNEIPDGRHDKCPSRNSYSLTLRLGERNPFVSDFSTQKLRERWDIPTGGFTARAFVLWKWNVDSPRAAEIRIAQTDDNPLYATLAMDGKITGLIFCFVFILRTVQFFCR